MYCKTLIFLFFVLSLASFSQKNDTSIIVTGFYNNLYSVPTETTDYKYFHKFSGNSKTLFSLVDTSISKLHWQEKTHGYNFNCFGDSNSLIGFKNSNLTIGLLKDLQFVKRLSTNSLFAAVYSLFYYSKTIFTISTTNARTASDNLFIQKLKMGDSLITKQELPNTQKVATFFIVKPTNKGLPTLYLPRGGHSTFTFGYFDTAFNLVDTLQFKHPVIVPDNNIYTPQRIFIKNNKLTVAGVQREPKSKDPLMRIPYKFDVDLNTGKVSNVWVDTTKNYVDNFWSYRPYLNFDQQGNLFVTGVAERKPWASYKDNFGIVNMIDTNNNLLIDTLIKYEGETNNTTHFVYHWGGENAIVGGHYDYRKVDTNTTLWGSVWYKKFKLQDWFLPTVGIDEVFGNSNEKNIVVYPNPSSKIVNLPKHVQLSIYDSKGILIKANYSSSTQLNVAHLPPGFYLLVLQLNAKDKPIPVKLLIK
jgi:hypothetical protein